LSAGFAITATISPCESTSATMTSDGVTVTTLGGALGAAGTPTRGATRLGG
jgi:hypothetical protein